MSSKLPMFGMLTRGNIKAVAQQLRDTFSGKRFAIASARYADSGSAEVRLITDAKFSANWTHEAISRHKIDQDEPILVSISGDRIYISFSAGNYYWTLDGDPIGTGYNGSERKMDGTYFKFDYGEFTFESVAPAGKGYLHKHMFKVQNHSTVED